MNDLARKLGDGPGLIFAKPITSNVTVSREGIVVQLKIGNAHINLKWRDALIIGQWIMARAAEAKFLDGETARINIRP